MTNGGCRAGRVNAALTECTCLPRADTTRPGPIRLDEAGDEATGKDEEGGEGQATKDEARREAGEVEKLQKVS